MTACERCSDRIVEVAGGGAGWTDDEAGHLAGCPDCTTEWRLQRAAAQLGRRLPPIDPAKIAGRLHRELAAARPDRRPLTSRRPVRWVLGLAAAAAVVLAVRLVGPSGGSAPADPVARVGLLSELDELSGQELASVLEVFDEDPLGPSADGPALGDLTADELERLLRNWEG